MVDSIKIDITGVESNVIQTLQNTYTQDLKVIESPTDKILQLEIPKSLQNDLLVKALDRFLSSFKNKTVYELTPSWTFDEKSSVIKGPTRKFFLTQKETIFLKMLLQNDKVVTYEEMTENIWEESTEVSQNAMRLFTRNLRKKLPSKVLKNFQGIGYKLVL